MSLNVTARLVVYPCNQCVLFSACSANNCEPVGGSQFNVKEGLEAASTCNGAIVIRDRRAVTSR